MDTRTILIIEDEPAAAKGRHPGEHEKMSVSALAGFLLLERREGIGVLMRT